MEANIILVATRPAGALVGHTIAGWFKDMIPDEDVFEEAFRRFLEGICAFELDE